MPSRKDYYDDPSAPPANSLVPSMNVVTFAAAVWSIRVNVRMDNLDFGPFPMVLPKSRLECKSPVFYWG